MILVRCRPSSWMQFSSLFLKSSMTRANNWRSIRTNFLTDGSLQIIQHTGFVSVNTRFQIPPKEKITRWNIGRTRGSRHVSETGNEVPGETYFRTMVIDSFAVCTVAPSCWKWPTQRKRMPTTLSPLGLPTEYYPFKWCQVPVGNPVF